MSSADSLPPTHPPTREEIATVVVSALTEKTFLRRDVEAIADAILRAFPGFSSQPYRYESEDNEGWAWVDEFLKLGGWRDVFQAQEALRAGFSSPSPPAREDEKPRRPMFKQDEESMAAALRPFGWTCGPGFWSRYYSDAWVFNLANAVVTLSERISS